ncbi:type II toxin-antitoxin system VapC family toxin [Mongoliimonas terrestris]|uniref:type II toxin-antitoxin system VapC family toxin n=1 Tax=Mongoliimonas terrestris TaxID=1709001 RepID=UPI000949546A|nr:type II toxin-antitoxin system VapC family toxin [Mongoliimonas terrestris]
MFIDASAIVAILAREADAESLLDRIEAAKGPIHVSPLVRFEAAVSLARSRSGAANRPDAATIAAAARLVSAFLDEIGAAEMPITDEIGRAALDAAMTFGKAVGHTADLDFGDCFAYACAKVGGVGLLYKGNDFARTDLA